MRKLYDTLVDSLAFVSMLIIVFLVLSICVDVVGRFFFNQPIGWVYEFAEHALVVLVFFGLAWLTRENGHITVDLLTNALPDRPRTFLHVLSSLAAAAVSGLVGYSAWISTFDSFARGVETTGIYPIPRGVMLAVVALGFTLTCIECLRIAIAAAIGRDKRAGEGAPPPAPTVSA